MDLTKALAPKSDQIDFADLEGKPPQIFTITKVSENGTELADQQPVNIRLAETDKFWRPSKGMLRVLADNWGKDVSAWVGRKVELYGDPNVYFGKEKRGGTRISRLSHITSPKKTLVNPRGGRGAYWEVKPLPDAPAQVAPGPDLAALASAFKIAGITDKTQMLTYCNQLIGRTITTATELTAPEVTQVMDALKTDTLEATE